MLVLASDLAQEFERRVRSIASFKGDNPPKEEIEGLQKWILDNFRIKSTKTPKGYIEEKNELERFYRILSTLSNPDGFVPGSIARMVWNAWDGPRGVREMLPRIIEGLTSEGGAKEMTREKKVGSNTYLNLVGASDKKLDEMISTVEASFHSLRGWRRKALEGGVTTHFSGPKDFRGTASGTYVEAKDILMIRATPGGRLEKASPGKYGSLEYVIVHELGHRYERKNPLPVDFDRAEWVTSRYSIKDGERFAELFAISNFDLQGPWDPERLNKFEAIMSGSRLAHRIAHRHLQASYFNVGDIILFGKWKNKKGRIVAFGQDLHGNPTVEIEPIPKGRKENKVFGLFKIWHVPADPLGMPKVASSPLIPTSEKAWNDGQVYWMPLAKDTFVHFTTRDRAEQIVASGKLLLHPPYPKMGIDKVLAISLVWGDYVAGVQTTHIKAPGEVVGVVFKTITKPEYGYIEEVVWGRDVVLISPKIIPMGRAVSLLKAAPFTIADNDSVTYSTGKPKTADLSPPLGYPGGPCQVVQRIEHEVRNPGLKQDLIEEVERGGKLSNPDASKIYDVEAEVGSGLIKRLMISAHGQYRMDLRGVTVPEVRLALKGFSKIMGDWKSQRHPSYQYYSDLLSRGQHIDWTDPKIGLTVVFVMRGRDTAVLITTYWKGEQDPSPPSHGECQLV